MSLLQPMMLALGGVCIGVGLLVQIFQPHRRLQGASMILIGISAVLMFWDVFEVSPLRLTVFSAGVVALLGGVIVLVWAELRRARQR